jgi:N6-L-threonylcarbamoyladenine synthase
MKYEEMSRRKAEELREQETVRILSLETSCDETAAAVIENGRKILSNVVFSQIDLHELYGGVVPEIASRAHMEACDRVIDQALKEAGMKLAEMDALAVTKGPGLVGALLTGVNCMKGLAYAAGKPLIGVNHIEGHVSANYLSSPDLEPPFLCLVVSGGHSHLVEVEDYGEYRLIGRTADDAAGEAFDKAARVLGLPYPGGPRMDVLAEDGNPESFSLPRPKTAGEYDYSFSGLKTAFINTVHTLEQKGEPLPKADLAASFRRAVCRELTGKAEKLLESLEAEGKGGMPFALAGGVSANRELRRMAAEMCGRRKVKLYMPEIPLCTDNGAMIGSAAYYRLLRGETADLSMNAEPALRLI